MVRCAGSVEIIHHPMKHGLASRVVDSPYSTFHRLVAEGVYPEGRAGRHADMRRNTLRYCALRALEAILAALEDVYDEVRHASGISFRYAREDGNRSGTTRSSNTEE